MECCKRLEKEMDALTLQVNENGETIDEMIDELAKLRQKAEADIAHNAKMFHDVLDHARKVSETFARTVTAGAQEVAANEIKRGYEKLAQIADQAETILQEKAVEACAKTEKRILARIEKEKKASWYDDVVAAFVVAGSAGGMYVLYTLAKSML